MNQLNFRHLIIDIIYFISLIIKYIKLIVRIEVVMKFNMVNIFFTKDQFPV